MQDKRSEVMNMLNRINRKLFTANGAGEDSFLGRGQMNVLKEIISHEKISQDELANVLKLDKTTVAKSVKKLESHGLITRNRSETDLRKKELVATEKALTMKEKMKRHFDESTKSFFEGITEKEIDEFKDVLEKIEANIEGNRTIMNKKRHAAMKVMRMIEQNENVTLDKLSELLSKDTEKVQEIIENLVTRGLVEKKDGVLSLVQGSLNREKQKDMNSMEHRRGRGHKEHKELFMHILNNNGISKDELAEQSGKDSEEIEKLIKHFESKGALEIKDGKIYADKEVMMKTRR